MSHTVYKDEHYIAALARLTDDRVLKHAHTFAVFDQHGDINLGFDGEQGCFHEGTRFLSRFSLLLGGQTPMLLSSVVRDDNLLLAVDLTNTEMTIGERTIRSGTLHLQRTIFLTEASCHECLRITNFGHSRIVTTLTFEYAADFKDIFEVRGERRARRGKLQAPEIRDSRIVLSYTGLDDVQRRTTLSWRPAPDEIGEARARFEIRLPAKQHLTIHFNLGCEIEGRSPAPTMTYEEALAAVRRRARVPSPTRGSEGDSEGNVRPCRVTTSNERFNNWLGRSEYDLSMMLTRLPEGPYPYAGVPWYNTVFGRDGIITALQMLWFEPSVAQGVLRCLAAWQAEAVDEERDAEPGKIVHEMRRGEMAALSEIPFGRYYGTVDATPLFVLLAGRYFERTGDLDFIESIWPNIQRALAWIDEYGDLDGDGFVEYERRSEHGLANQGWKDSFDSIMHADGEPAEGPIALCEVQGYVYAARVLAAKLAEALEGRASGGGWGPHALAGAWEPRRGSGQRDQHLPARLREQAAALKQRFNEAFWCEGLSTFALALDGKKRRCCVRSSNPGHCLFTDIVADEYARPLAESLMGDDMFSGWGVRTLSTSAPVYNPMSYHNGSIWPHDNSLVAAGLARYGFTQHALTIMMALFDAAGWCDRYRLPELFCGFNRVEGQGPVGYPVACSPQAWAAGAPFMLLRAALGLWFDAPNRALRLEHPILPPGLEEVAIRNLRVGAATVDLSMRRRHDTVDVAVEREEGELAVVVTR